MANWQTGTQTIGPGRAQAPDITVQVEPGTGTVEVQLMDPSGSWYTPAAAEYTLDVKDVFTLTRSNRPQIRLQSTGDAAFLITGL